MREYYESQLAKLNTEMIQMGARCEDAISGAIQALLENNRALAEKVEGFELEIDQYERDIERLCMRLLLLQQPVATDLRVVSSALKMISDLERIGDQAADIADITKHVSFREYAGKVHIKEMAKAAIGMVTDTQLISRVANASIYVCRADYTHKADYTLINELGEQKKLPNLCTIINGLDMKKKKYGYYYGYGKYGKYYGYGKKYGYGYGYLAENLVYLELKRTGYNVYVGSLRNKEVDFIAQKADRTIYLQSTYMLTDEATVEREYSALKAIDDNFEKVVISLDEITMPLNEGIRHIKAWELDKIL